MVTTSIDAPIHMSLRMMAAQLILLGELLMLVPTTIPVVMPMVPLLAVVGKCCFSIHSLFIRHRRY